MSDQLEINGYKLEKPLTTNNSGFAKWGFATKNEQRFFIKEFLSPVYPKDNSGLSERMIQSKREVCEKFKKEKKTFYDRLKQCRTGNIVIVDEFFRSGSRFYTTTECIDSVSDSLVEVSRSSHSVKWMLCKLLAYNFAILHKNGIIHADVKPSNILVKKTQKGYITAKIIDFDSSFLRESPPVSSEDVHGDFIYLAPEVFFRMRDEAGELTEKLDIFALGILFHQYWCMKAPTYNSKYNYLFEAVVNNESISLDESLPEDLRQLITRMILLDPADRPSAEECYIALGGKSLAEESGSDSLVDAVERALQGEKNGGALGQATPFKRAGDLL